MNQAPWHRRASRIVLAVFAALASPLSAHEGVDHHSTEFEAAAPLQPMVERPQWQADGTLHVSKPAQHLLGLRTAMLGDAADGEAGPVREWIGEIATQPETGTLIAAPQAGRLEPLESGWPVAGQTIRAGQTLAWLRPLLPERDRARRAAKLADLDQKIGIAQLNVDRIGLQNKANQGQVSAGNIYIEQAEADLKAFQQQRQLLAVGLAERLPLKAAVSGRLIDVPASAGAMVIAGQPLFELANTTRLRVLAMSFEPQAGTRLQSAWVEGQGDSAHLPLVWRGVEPLTDRPGWRLLFDLPSSAPAGLQPGQPVRVLARLRSARGVTVDPAACVRDDAGRSVVWLHRAPEQFVAQPIGACADPVGLHRSDRVVVSGAALLSQYR